MVTIVTPGKHVISVPFCPKKLLLEEEKTNNRPTVITLPPIRRTLVIPTHLLNLLELLPGHPSLVIPLRRHHAFDRLVSFLARAKSGHKQNSRQCHG